MTPRASVVIATYNRAESLERLLRQLSAQDVAREIEVVVIDDGSQVDPSPRVRAVDAPFTLTFKRQSNAGAAAARHHGVEIASAPIVVFLDDDMQIHASFVSAHLEFHARDERAVVLGRIKPDPGMSFELFERFHADVLERFGADVIAGRATLRGPNLYTGNVSMRRDAYLRVGGFDPTFGHSEDAELGVRLEKDGATFHLSDAAVSIHSSDRASLEGWRARAKKYGVFDSRIGKKHPDVPHASPWRYFRELSLASRPLLALSLAVPRAGETLAGGALAIASACDRFGGERVALHGATLAFGLDYARGMREESGALADVLGDWIDFIHRAGPAGFAERIIVAAARMRDAVRADHETFRRSAAKYSARVISEEDLPHDIVARIGFQMLVAVRVMHFFRDAGAIGAAMTTSRLIRHAYGSDIHWDARIEPGVQFVHGMGLAISAKACIERDVILFQNVTLGESSNGAPKIGRGVHVGPGATLLGPITVGEGSKIMSNCVVRESIPARSLVASPSPSVRARG